MGSLGSFWALADALGSFSASPVMAAIKFESMDIEFTDMDKSLHAKFAASEPRMYPFGTVSILALVSSVWIANAATVKNAGIAVVFMLRCWWRGIVVESV